MIQTTDNNLFPTISCWSLFTYFILLQVLFLPFTCNQCMFVWDMCWAGVFIQEILAASKYYLISLFFPFNCNQCMFIWDMCWVRVLIQGIPLQVNFTFSHLIAINTWLCWAGVLIWRILAASKRGLIWRENKTSWSSHMTMEKPHLMGHSTSLCKFLSLSQWWASSLCLWMLNHELDFVMICFVYLCLFIIFRSESWHCRFDSLLFDSYRCHTIDSLHCHTGVVYIVDSLVDYSLASL